MSKLLLDSKPLVILPELACAVGLNEAIVLQQLHYWLDKNLEAERNYYDGYYWSYNSYESWVKQFPFWSVATIKRTLSHLKRLELIIVNNYNKMKFDKTLWYRIDYRKLEQLAPLSEIVSGIGRVKMTSSIGSNCTYRQPCGFPAHTPKKVRSLQEFMADRNSPDSSTAEEDFKRIQEIGF